MQHEEKRIIGRDHRRLRSYLRSAEPSDMLPAPSVDRVNTDWVALRIWEDDGGVGAFVDLQLKSRRN